MLEDTGFGGVNNQSAPGSNKGKEQYITQLVVVIDKKGTKTVAGTQYPGVQINLSPCMHPPVQQLPLL